ncbi:MAG: tetratricopeptide repeat protein [Pirellulales bacterium]|nr:tetratricopeptide repeat protein [Pirellulales bacterium]
MRRLISAILTLVLALASTSPASAQADAGQAYQDAKAAYEAGQFGQARDSAQKASETDPDNPEVYLLLGKAHYQLGELDEAITAWKRTLALAPEQPYAKQMLDVLRGQAAAIDVRIRLIEMMIQERLYAPARTECAELLVDQAPSDAQRARVMILQAESLVRMHKGPDARRVLHELLTSYPQLADPVQSTLLLGEAKLQGDPRSVAEALTLLRKVVADHPETPAAVDAQYDLIRHAPDLRWEPAQWEASRAEAMAEWLAAHGDHRWAQEGRRLVIDAYLALTLRGPKPTAKSDLSPTDVKALDLAAQFYGQSPPAEEANKLTSRLLKQLKDHYTAHGARLAAAKAMETLLAAPLPPDNRLAVLRELASAKYLLGAEWLEETAQAGRLPVGVARGQLPERLTDVLSVFRTIRREYPAEPFWIDQANLAKRVRASASRVLPTAEFKGLRSPDAWALDIALPVIKADADAAAVTSAIETVLGIIQECAKLNKSGSRILAVELSTELLNTVSSSHPSWPKVITSYYTVAGGYAHYVFQENTKAGRAGENAKLSEQQKAMLAVLKDHVAGHAAHAPHALAQLAEHVKPWVAHGHWAAAEEAYAAVADALPEKERRQADLAVVNLWIQQVTQEHQRLVAVGLTVPRELDATLKKALLRCYQLQAGLDQEPAILTQVRSTWDSVVGHYKMLDYYDVAEEAIQLKPEAAVDAADEYAALQLAFLQDQLARRELTRFLGQFGASEKIVLGPEFAKVIAAYTKLITDRPASTLVPQATEKVFAIGRLFEQRGAFSVAAGVYGDFAKFAAGVKVLADAAPGASSTAERAAFAVATALDAQARKVLQKASADRQSGDPPPAKLSDEFTAAIAAYKGFIEAYPKSQLMGQATSKIMAVAYEYAKIDAWDVADSVYAGLLGSKLPIRRPERLQFCRGLCQLGRAMPDHAREVLAVLTVGGLRGSDEGPAVEMLAIRNALDVRVLGRGGRGTDSDSVRPNASGPADQQIAMSQSAVVSAPQPAAPPAQAVERVEPQADAVRDSQLLAMIRQQESSRAAQVAQLREGIALSNLPQRLPVQQEQAQGQQGGLQVPAAPVLSEAELARQEKALHAAYAIFQAVCRDHPRTPTADQARGEILVMVSHWRSLNEWERSAALALRFLTDHPTDPELPKLRLEVARDRLAWAAKPIARKASKVEMLSEVSQRFDAARKELERIVADFPNERSAQQDAQWDLASSYLTQARVVAAFSPVLARGQYVRTTRELRRVAETYPDHPKIGTIPQMLWNISTELEGRGYDEEAILVWNELAVHDPMHPLAQQASLKIAQTYHQKLKRPLRAAETYQELNFARGGNDQELQNAIFQIGSELRDQKRWVEALHVLETFVDSFPKHAQAGEALAMVGQIHQANEAWKEAIAAYRRVIAEFENGQFVQQAKWAIAECTINLSQWREASDAYREYVKAYPNDAQVAEANRRIEVLKDLARYQGLVDEQGQRKAFDAQFQIAVIVAGQLSNPVKAIIEYRKVATDWSDSHLADDALYAVGTTYLSLGEKEKAREALLAVAVDYPTSSLADNALFTVGSSYEDEAAKLATVTRESTLARNKDIAQRRAYQLARMNVSRQAEVKNQRIADLKKAGKGKLAEVEEASVASNYGQFNDANTLLFAQMAEQEVETLTAAQLADRQDKINAALRKAVQAYTKASQVAGADKADDALLQMATIYDEQLKDSEAAMQTWLEIVLQFSGTDVAQNASWRIAETYQRQGKYAEAIEAHKAFLRNYRGSDRAGAAQFAIAENYEQLGQWVNAMDSYTNYLTNYPEGPLATKAKEQINWIKTYRL